MTRSRKYPARLLMTPQCVGALAAGLGLGMLSMMPFGLRVTDAVAGLMGAIVGAFAGIAGALGVVAYTSFNQGRNVADYLIHALIPVTRGNRTITKICNDIQQLENKHKESWTRLHTEATRQLDRIGRAKHLLKRIEPVVTVLNASSLRSYARIEENLDAMSEYMAQIYEDSKNGEELNNGAIHMDISRGLKDRDLALNRAANRLADDYGLPRLADIGQGTLRALPSRSSTPVSVEGKN